MQQRVVLVCGISSELACLSSKIVSLITGHKSAMAESSKFVLHNKDCYIKLPQTPMSAIAKSLQRVLDG